MIVSQYIYIAESADAGTRPPIQDTPGGKRNNINGFSTADPPITPVHHDAYFDHHSLL
ncbi:hypothetical protein B0G82_1426 [Paraburkholderia sp. BL17N1]|nr:hypothetical protein B0G82_1426 [Paraburkholderia sp. BL17N1]